jgi:hypothetical protein
VISKTSRYRSTSSEEETKRKWTRGDDEDRVVDAVNTAPLWRKSGAIVDRIRRGTELLA